MKILASSNFEMFGILMNCITLYQIKHRGWVWIRDKNLGD